MSDTVRVWMGGGARPLPLDRPDELWSIEQGYANVFHLDDHGVRRHLFRLDAGAWLIGSAPGTRSVAVGSIDSRFVSVAPGDVAATMATAWVAGLAGAVPQAVGTWLDVVATPGERRLAAGGRLRLAGETGCWIRIEEGGGWLSGTAALPVGTWFAFPPHGWIEARADTRIVVAAALPEGVEPAAPARALSRSVFDAFERGAAADTAAAGERRRAARLRAQEAMAHGLALLTGRTRSDAPPPDTDALTAALTTLCRAIGHAGPLPTIPAEGPETDRLERAVATAELSSREVILRPGWWRIDGVPLLARTDDGGWIALLPRARGGWQASGVDGIRPVDAALAQRISGDAIQLYPALPARPLGFRDLMALAGLGLRRDLATVAAMGVAAGLAALAVPYASRTLFDGVVPLGDTAGLQQILFALVAVALGLAAFDFVKAAALLRAEARLDANLQAAVFDRLLRLPVGFFRRFSAGDLAQRTLGFQSAREMLSGAALTGVLSTVFALVNFAVMLSIDLRLAAVAVPATGVIVGVSALLARAQLRHERRRTEAKGHTDGFMLQLLVGIGKLRAAAAEPRGMAQWARRMTVERRAIYAAQRIAAVQAVAQAVLPGAATMAIFLCVVAFAKADLVAGKLGALVDPATATAAATLTTGGFIAFSAAFGQLTAALSNAALSATQLLAVAPLLERVRPLIETAPEVTENRQPPGRLRGAIDLRGVTFRYNAGGPTALAGLDLAIAPGEFVAIVGPSGSGKSTILRLLLGFEKAERGEIFFDGTGIDRLDTRALRQQIGIVLQNGRITAGSLFENIAGTSGEGLNDAWAAARLVDLAADIEAMPMGMHTVLTDGGRTLSGGQRQRVLLARALVRRPAILLLDEATSALDNRTQSVVTQSLSRLSITRLVIAHRLSTIREVDRILVVDGGKLVEMGRYDDLMAQDGAFAALARRQLL